MSETVTEVMLYVREYFESEQWPPESLEKFVKWIQIYLEEIPTEFRSSATIEIESDDSGAIISIQYERPQTAKEASDKVSKAENRRRELETRELRTLKQLLDKYGPKVQTWYDIS